MKISGFLAGKSDRVFWAIAIFLCAGLGLRFWHLSGPSLWEDELFSVGVVLNNPLLPPAGGDWFRSASFHQLQAGDTFWTIKGADQSPPLFELVAKLFVAVFGDSEWALRLPSALAAAAALGLLAWLAWRRRGQPDGMVCVTMLALMACCGLLVFYAQEARAYSLGTALTTALTLFFLQRLRQGWQQASLPGWGEVTLAILAALTHYSALILAAVLLAGCGWQAARRHDWRALARMALIPLCALAWIVLAHRGYQMARKGHIGWIAERGYPQALALVAENLADKALGWPLALILLLALALGLAAVAKKDAAASPAPAAPLPASMLWALLGAVAVYGLLSGYVVYKSRIEHPRHLTFVLPLVFAAAGVAVARVRAYSRAGAWLLLALMVAASWPGLKAWQMEQRSDFRSVAQYALARLQDGDLVLMGPMATAQELAYYVGPRTGRHMRLDALRDADSACQAIEQAMTQTGRVGIVSPGAHEPLMNAIEQQCGAPYAIDKTGAMRTLGQVWTRR